MKIVIFRPRFQSDGEFLIETFFFPLKHSAGPRSRLAAAQQSQWRDHVKLHGACGGQNANEVSNAPFTSKKKYRTHLRSDAEPPGEAADEVAALGWGSLRLIQARVISEEAQGKAEGGPVANSPSRGRQEEDIFVRPKRTISKDFANISQDQAPNY